MIDISPEDHTMISMVARRIMYEVLPEIVEDGDIVEKRCIKHTGESEEVLVRTEYHNIRIRVDIVEQGYRLDEEILQ